ncbi:uncharacterized protein LOC114264730 isoform X2 [Camellia sinensis]|uniref:uncharacterized protein LOC114264730 isoform X2 n=1 Tax=Camellia sinensis TaxID=4442 RepID=UPI0010368505|nr:uncharacterized protein LOC114264730 isoform X2 [Camellia sinensis]
MFIEGILEMSNSDKEWNDDHHDENTEDEGSTLETQQHNNILLATVATVAVTYATNYLMKEPCRTSSLTGGKWMEELQEGNQTRIFENFRMEREVFYQLCDLLHTKYGLETGQRVSVQEQVAIFLYIVGGDTRNINTQERFQHSSETISKYFKNVLKAITMMFIDWVRPQPRNGVHPYIRRKRKYYPHFKDCIGAIDGTHIKAYLSPDKQSRLIGWEGSAHNTRIFLDTIRNPSYNFPKPQ